MLVVCLCRPKPVGNMTQHMYVRTALYSLVFGLCAPEVVFNLSHGLAHKVAEHRRNAALWRDRFWQVLTGSDRSNASQLLFVESSWNVMAHGEARVGKWEGNWRMEWIANTLHTTSEYGVSSITTITTADAHTSAASSRLNWSPRRFKWIRPFRRKTKYGFFACAITFQTQSTTNQLQGSFSMLQSKVTKNFTAGN